MLELSEVTAPAETRPESGACPVGDTLTLSDDYVSDGKPVQEDVDWTLKAVDDDIQLSGTDAEIYGKPGYRWLRLDFEVMQNGSTATDLLAENISAVDSENHTYNAEPVVSTRHSPTAPRTQPHCSRATPGASRYIGIPVPETAKVTSIRVKDSGYQPPSTAEWKLSISFGRPRKTRGPAEANRWRGAGSPKRPQRGGVSA